MQHAERLVATAKWRNVPIWVDSASRELGRLFPNSGLDKGAIATILRALVIERGGSLAP
jgi:hypothetical protein